MEAERAGRAMAELLALYPEAGAELNFSNPFETLIATILSAQCTDKRVNMVTEALFQRYPDAAALASADAGALSELIKPCGLYRTKCKNILAACRVLVDDYGGVPPEDRARLMALPGVGQKTAGVVLMAAFGADEIPVDTHVFRVSNRIGLAKSDTPEGVEEQLRAVLALGTRAKSHHLLIWHGRRVCHARKPECDKCPLKDGLCEYYETSEGM